MLPREVIEPLRGWLHGLATDATVRANVVRHTLDGAIRSLAGRVFRLAASADAQADAVARLRREVDDAYDDALIRVDAASGDGSLLRGEVLARWQEFVGTGELMRALESKVGRVRDRVTAAVRGRPQPGAELAEALENGVEALVRAAADEAADRAGSAWRDDPAGQTLLGEDDLRQQLARSWPRRRNGRPASGRATSSSWCVSRARASGRPRATSRSASTGSD